MAAKKSTAEGDKPMTKSAFIRSFDPSVPADEVVAKGKEAGLELTKKMVWTMQSEMRTGGFKKGKKPSKAKAGTKAPVAKAVAAAVAAPKAESPKKAKSAPAPKKAAPKAAPAKTSTGSAEQKLKALVIELGTARAEEVYRSVRAQLSAITGA